MNPAQLFTAKLAPCFWCECDAGPHPDHHTCEFRAMALNTFLETTFPDRFRLLEWGELRRYSLPNGKLRWLCPTHRAKLLG